MQEKEEAVQKAHDELLKQGKDVHTTEFMLPDEIKQYITAINHALCMLCSHLYLNANLSGFLFIVSKLALLFLSIL